MRGSGSHWVHPQQSGTGFYKHVTEGNSLELCSRHAADLLQTAAVPTLRHLKREEKVGQSRGQESSALCPRIPRGLEQKEPALYTENRSFSSVAQSCPTLHNPVNRSTAGLPVHHQLPEFTQTHIHQVGDAIQPSHPLSSPFPPALNPSQHQSLFQ